VAAAHSYKPDLLVLATLGRNGLQRWLRGSVAESVTRRAPCPTLLVRSDHPARPELARVLVPLDASREAETALDYLGSRFLPGTLHLALVAASGLAPSRHYVPAKGDARQAIVADLEAYLQRRAEELRRQGWSVETRAVDARAGAAIVAAALDLKADMVVMATHARTGLARWALGSVTERVVREGPCPTLVVRAAAGVFSPARRPAESSPAPARRAARP
jgi:nucleotide-binding universal stress UspA family protein